MLVLSRRQDDKILFPHLGISVQVLRIAGKTVRLGVTAPPDVTVLRHELADQVPDHEIHLPRVSLADLSGKLRGRLHAAANELQELHARLEEGKHDSAETTLFRVFRELKAVDDYLASGTQAGSPNVEELLQARRRALVVDDNCNESRLLAGFLRCRSFDVDTACDGAAAMEILENQASPDCVLLDMDMPRYDGNWTITEIRKNPEFARLKVFAVSGIDPKEYGVEIGPGGIDRWFRKPIDPEALVLHLGLNADTPSIPA